MYISFGSIIFVIVAYAERTNDIRIDLQIRFRLFFPDKLFSNKELINRIYLLFSTYLLMEENRLFGVGEKIAVKVQILTIMNFENRTPS